MTDQKTNDEQQRVIDNLHEEDFKMVHDWEGMKVFDLLTDEQRAPFLESVGQLVRTAIVTRKAREEWFEKAYLCAKVSPCKLWDGCSYEEIAQMHSRHSNVLDFVPDKIIGESREEIVSRSEAITQARIARKRLFTTEDTDNRDKKRRAIVHDKNSKSSATVNEKNNDRHATTNHKDGKVAAMVAPPLQAIHNDSSHSFPQQQLNPKGLTWTTLKPAFLTTFKG